uniref:Uncharacterized protein n=1 Tax=Chromera velia CCMP2878 TaxID=1169474 RepID=A0A0G4GZE0_9ALVE|eukprot:Cvel_23960.t1-p1 / transcript=Cvel_23960.t1 / gene=Cvel_23960 / organism=Chromera_velia_CCMP2878 / gene_product=hypothetical protein / transcript_product=hypothetical protein / location=Cvel_scaffold2533:4154-16174(-) / protein_length=340 / sequence_SO=supercontig / SO=protein_coding / is_pseudo=false
METRHAKANGGGGGRTAGGGGEQQQGTEPSEQRGGKTLVLRYVAPAELPLEDLTIEEAVLLPISQRRQWVAEKKIFGMDASVFAESASREGVFFIRNSIEDLLPEIEGKGKIPSSLGTALSIHGELDYWKDHPTDEQKKRIGRLYSRELLNGRPRGNLRPSFNLQDVQDDPRFLTRKFYSKTNNDLLFIKDCEALKKKNSEQKVFALTGDNNIIGLAKGTDIQIISRNQVAALGPRQERSASPEACEKVLDFNLSDPSLDIQSLRGDFEFSGDSEASQIVKDIMNNKSQEDPNIVLLITRLAQSLGYAAATSQHIAAVEADNAVTRHQGTEKVFRLQRFR